MSYLNYDYAMQTQQMIARKQATLPRAGIRNTTAPSYLQQSEPDTFLGKAFGDVGSGNFCSDGKDDGKIGFFSAVGNIAQGAVRGATNMVKNAVKHPFKTAAMVGACFIPVVGPVIAGGLATYGIYQGGKQVVNAVSTAAHAKTDAEAKAAFENIGAGTLTVGVSGLALKGSIGQFKAQTGIGNGGQATSTTVNAFKNAKASNASTLDIAKTVIREGAKETASNATSFAKVVKENTYDKAVKGFKYAKQNGFKATAQELAAKGLEQVKSGANKVSNAATKGIDGLNSKIQNFDPAQVRTDLSASAAKIRTTLAQARTNPSGFFKVKASEAAAYARAGAKFIDQIPGTSEVWMKVSALDTQND